MGEQNYHYYVNYDFIDVFFFIQLIDMIPADWYSTLCVNGLICHCFVYCTNKGYWI